MACVSAAVVVCLADLRSWDLSANDVCVASRTAGYTRNDDQCVGVF